MFTLAHASFSFPLTLARVGETIFVWGVVGKDAPHVVTIAVQTVGVKRVQNIQVQGVHGSVQ